MTREEFQSSSRRVLRVGGALMCALGIALFSGVMLFAEKTTLLAAFGTFVRSKVANEAMVGVIGGVAMGIPLALLLAATVLPVVWIDRHSGKRCPGCARSLTLRCMPSHVLASGRCPFCNTPVFDA